jgi:hypothetical protein
MSDCAVADNGTLKDANDIQWFNNADYIIPIPASRPLTASSSVSSVTSLDDYFASHLPAKKVGGKRQSTRIHIPSKRTADPDNAEATGSAGEDASSGRKRKVGISGASHCVARKVVESESGSEKSSDDGNMSASDDKQPDSNDTERNSDNNDDDTCMDAKYNRLKSLGDEDREVRTLFC